MQIVENVSSKNSLQQRIYFCGRFLQKIEEFWNKSRFSYRSLLVRFFGAININAVVAIAGKPMNER